MTGGACRTTACRSSIGRKWNLLSPSIPSAALAVLRMVLGLRRCRRVGPTVEEWYAEPGEASARFRMQVADQVAGTVPCVERR